MAGDMFSPFPKMSLASKGRKTIHYLQQMKDEGTPIVQHCPTMLSPIFTMAADMAGVDICRLPPSGGAADPQVAVDNAIEWITSYRQVARRIHINYVANTVSFTSNEKALGYFSKFFTAGADSILPMGINNETLKFVSDNHCTIYGHVGALSGWMTMGLYGGYKKLAKTAESAMQVFRMAYEYQENGMKAMSIELTPFEVTEAITKKLRVPVIGIAASGGADGYEMVDGDIFGMMAKPAMHAKTYGSLVKFAVDAYGAWANDVHTSAYPEDKNGWHMDEAECEKFLNAIEKI